MNASTQGAARQRPEQAPQRAPWRFISAASLFDGHDAAINMIRRLLQAHGAEVVHLGHNRSVSDIVRAALQDASSVAGLLITTEAMVAEAPKKEAAPPMPGGGGMGGMDY